MVFMRLGWLAALMLLIGGPEAWAQAPSDIVWPTYDQAERASDSGLACAGLETEIAHVASDISLLRKAQTQVEQILHTAFDMERYGTRNGAGGMPVAAGASNGKESYAAARGEIVASLRVAERRRDYLKGLEPGCKSGPQPVAAP